MSKFLLNLYFSGDKRGGTGDVEVGGLVGLGDQSAGCLEAGLRAD